MRTAPYITVVAALLLPLTTAGQPVPTLEEVWVLEEGLNMPESVVMDADREVLYVSNIVGDVSEKDGDGHISRVSMDGELIEERWVDSLDAPKGLALRGNRLFVSDVDQLVEIDVATASVVGRFPAENAQFLNDVAVDHSGQVYVSDSRGQSGIYRLADDMLHLWLQDDMIASPNGLFAEEDRLIVAAGQVSDEAPGMSRVLKAISYDDRRSVETLPGAAPMGALDAVEASEHGGYFLTDWAGGVVSYFARGGEVILLEEIEQGTADLTYVQDLQMVFLPLMLSDRLVAYRVVWED